MKKLTIVGLAVGCLILISTSSAQALVTINFDTLADNTLVNTQYSSLGVIFDNEYADNYIYSSPISSPTWLSGENADGHNGIAGPPISGYFVDPSNSAVNATTDFVSGRTVFADDATTSHLEVYDLNNILLASTSIFAGDYISLGYSGIHSFNFYWTGGGSLNCGSYDDIVGIDNLSFNEVTPIPEPATLSLLGIGLLSLAGLRRRR